MSKGKLTAIAGPMFSGKTSKLLAMVNVFTRMGDKVLIVKPQIDNRYSGEGEIHSHDHRNAPALLFNGETAQDMLTAITEAKPDKVIFDEVQFFDKDKVKEVVIKLKKQGIHVIVSGLLYDFRRHPFGATSELIGLADESCELFAVCQKCGNFARHSERVSGSQSQIEVGESDKYIAVCEKCHMIYGD